MAGSLFPDPEIDAQIKVDILRLQAAALEWDEDPKGRGFDDHIVWTLSESLDAHAKAYLSKVESEDLVAEYVDYLRRVGAALISNAERRSFLSNPYSEGCLRKMAENTGRIVIRRHELTPEQYEAEVRAEVERCRSQVMPAAKEWNEWYCQMLVRIETHFEARYRYWEANAIERTKAGKEGPLAEWFRRVQRELYPDATTDPHAHIPDCWKKVLPVSFFNQIGAPNVSESHEHPPPLPPSRVDEKLKPQNSNRRNPRYKQIDAALKEISKSRPHTQEEVFQSLDGRHIPPPPAEPFHSTRGWMAGFGRDRSAARAWLSKRWSELNLTPLPRGPKGQRK